MDALKLLIALINYEWITNESYLHESILTKAIWKLWTVDYDNYFVCQSVGTEHYENWKCLHSYPNRYWHIRINEYLYIILCMKIICMTTFYAGT